MFAQIARIAKAMAQYRRWQESDPEWQQELAYAEKSKEHSRAREDLTDSIELSESLQRKLEKLKSQSKGTSSLELELQNCKNRLETLSTQAQELEKELFSLYTKKQVLIARDKANYERRKNDGTYRFSLSNPERKDVETLMISKDQERKSEPKSGIGGGVLFALTLLSLLIYCFSMRI